MKKSREMNYELIRKMLIKVFEDYKSSKDKSKVLSQMKELVKDYDDVIEILEETLNCSFGIMDALVKGEIKDKNEEKQIINEILKELQEKSYLGA